MHVTGVQVTCIYFCHFSLGTDIGVGNTTLRVSNTLFELWDRKLQNVGSLRHSVENLPVYRNCLFSDTIVFDFLKWSFPHDWLGAIIIKTITTIFQLNPKNSSFVMSHNFYSLQARAIWKCKYCELIWHEKSSMTKGSTTFLMISFRCILSSVSQMCQMTFGFLVHHVLVDVQDEH